VATNKPQWVLRQTARRLGSPCLAPCVCDRTVRICVAFARALGKICAHRVETSPTQCRSCLAGRAQFLSTALRGVSCLAKLPKATPPRFFACPLGSNGPTAERDDCHGVYRSGSFHTCCAVERVAASGSGREQGHSDDGGGHEGGRHASGTRRCGAATR
jgi:hypothetical protein